ncbi:MAG: DMT family transporter [Rhodospirillaceae bacterium]|nr:MAG: DMT family transporter [Rhodospirillaceae bacterium]
MAAVTGAPDKHHPVAGILWMLGAACCFAASLTLVKALQEDGMTPFQAVLFRQIFGLVIFIPVILRAGAASLKTPVPARHGMRAVFGFMGMCTGYYSLTLINVADSVALQFTLPIFTTICAIWLLGEKLHSHRVIATLIGFGGVLLIVRPGFAEINLGVPLALFAAASYAISDTMSRWVARDDPFTSIMMWNFIFMIPLAAIPSAYFWVTPDAGLWLQVLGFSAAGVGAQFCLTRSFGLAEASLVSPILFLRLPLIAAIAFFVWGETTEIWTWIGAGIIFIATTWMTRVETKIVAKSG